MPFPAPMDGLGLQIGTASCAAINRVGRSTTVGGGSQLMILLMLRRQPDGAPSTPSEPLAFNRYMVGCEPTTPVEKFQFNLPTVLPAYLP